MKFNLLKLVVYSLCILTMNSCLQKESDFNLEKPDVFITALEEGDFYTTDKNIAFLIHNDSLYHIATTENGFTEDAFMLHFLKDDSSFINADFLVENKKLTKKFKHTHPKLTILVTPINSYDFTEIRTGQYTRDSNGKPINIWAKQILKTTLGKRKNLYTNEIDEILGINFLNAQFQRNLEQGVFFENPFGFYILLSKKYIYLITSKQTDLTSPIMLHFVKEDNTFDNLSFQFKSHQINTHLGKPFKQWQIAKIPLMPKPYIKVRLGQYTPKGNIWAQEFWPKELWQNPLLKYNGELTITSLK